VRPLPHARSPRSRLDDVAGMPATHQLDTNACHYATEVTSCYDCRLRHHRSANRRDVRNNSTIFTRRFSFSDAAAYGTAFHRMLLFATRPLYERYATARTINQTRSSSSLRWRRWMKNSTSYLKLYGGVNMLAERFSQPKRFRYTVAHPATASTEWMSSAEPYSACRPLSSAFPVANAAPRRPLNTDRCNACP